MKIAKLTIPCNAKAQRKLADSLAIVYGVKRKILESRIDYIHRVLHIATNAAARDMQVDGVSLIADPHSAPLSMYVYEDNGGGKRSILFPPWE